MRVITKKGDVFSAVINDKEKKYFQYIANDLTQLNSDVIRAFKAKHPVDKTPDISEILSDDVDFYAHCAVNLGVKMNLWTKIGKSDELGALDDILFRCTSDYGHKVGDVPKNTSSKWYVWKINDTDFTRIGKLEGTYKESFIGLVFNPLGIIELLKGNKYPVNYPE